MSIASRIRSRWKRWLCWILCINLIGFTFLALYFPGAQLPIALTLATGIQKAPLQQRIDACEQKAIEQQPFTPEDIQFLSDLYTCLYKGARLTIILPEVSKMMAHYLEQSGESLPVEASIFNTNAKVQAQMKVLRSRIAADNAQQSSYQSDSFYMPDASNLDSVFGLYYGTLIATPAIENDTQVIHWRGEVPWEWPSYEFLQEKYGDPQEESFPIPNAACLVKGLDGAIFIDNGLGEYITHLGLAKEFLVYAEWTEVVD